jgi:hypothetical protein
MGTLLVVVRKDAAHPRRAGAGQQPQKAGPFDGSQSIHLLSWCERLHSLTHEHR